MAQERLLRGEHNVPLFGRFGPQGPQIAGFFRKTFTKIFDSEVLIT